MDEEALFAVLAAHRGRAMVVAELYVLRQPALGASDVAFLEAQARALDLLSLERWLVRGASPDDRRGAVVELARRAMGDAPTIVAHVEHAAKAIGDAAWRELEDAMAPALTSDQRDRLRRARESRAKGEGDRYPSRASATMERELDFDLGDVELPPDDGAAQRDATVEALVAEGRTSELLERAALAASRGDVTETVDSVERAFRDASARDGAARVALVCLRIAGGAPGIEDLVASIHAYADARGDG